MLNADQLTAERPDDTQEVELPKLGGSVRVRGLTRAEANRIVGKPMDAAEAERKLLHFAMVEPVMTEDQVRAWQKVAPAGEIERIAKVIRELSGLGADAVKEDMARFPE